MAVPKAAPPIQEQWPAEVSKHYEPVRTLGIGGFASVTLAKKKKPTATDEKLVAMKICGNKDATRSDLSYAHREIDILKEIKHENIMRIVDFWEPAPKEHKCAAVIALAYHKGPTLDALLNHGGALSSTFGRVVTAQLVDAISFLHSHAVIHRDIKPDNVLVSGASSKDSAIWDEEVENPAVEPCWKELRRKWHVTIIDFGFARALTPDDVTKPSLDLKKENLDASYHVNNMDALAGSSHSRLGGSRGSGHSSRGGSNLDSSTRSTRRSTMDGSGSSRSRGRRNISQGKEGDEMNKSISRRFTKRMSALGNRNFAAPEITSNVKREQKSHPANVLVTSTAASASAADEVDITETISEFVSDYGLLVDAFSLGCTIRYMMTGVPPHRRVEDVIAEQKSMGRRITRWVGKKTGSIDRNERKKKYCLLDDLPGSVSHMIGRLTEKSVKNRLSVRAARRYPWIFEVLPDDSPETGPEILSYLECALKHSQQAS
jgi:serine/threonine protein kinase